MLAAQEIEGYLNKATSACTVFFMKFISTCYGYKVKFSALKFVIIEIEIYVISFCRPYPENESLQMVTSLVRNEFSGLIKFLFDVHIFPLKFVYV